MRNKVQGVRCGLLTVLLLVWCCCIGALAEGLSGDNSLSSLGILTDGVTVSPEFVYSTIEYQVTVPAGTTELSLDPVTSNSSAEILDISGTTLDENGEGTVAITVMAENGSSVVYYLYVKQDEAAAVAETEAPTEKETEKVTEAQTETEVQTEDPRYVKVDRNSLEEAENTIATLKSETANYRDRQALLMKILYGMIAFCVVLLFAVINLILKKKDLKTELKAYRAYGYQAGGEENSQGGNDSAYAAQDGYAGVYDSQGNYIVGQSENAGAYNAQGGCTGQAGTAGAYDAQGCAGQAGTAGAYDVQGYAGQAGTAGAYDVQGYAGQAGTAGVYDAQGYAGQAGTAGAYDAQGYAGQTGNTGSCGAQGSHAAQQSAVSSDSSDSADQTIHGTAEGGRGKWQSSAQGQMTIRYDAAQKVENGQTQSSTQSKAALNDDPATVPKPSRARKKTKQMPEYQKSTPVPEYQPNTESGKKDIEVTMIDL